MVKSESDLPELPRDVYCLGTGLDQHNPDDFKQVKNFT